MKLLLTKRTVWPAIWSLVILISLTLMVTGPEAAGQTGKQRVLIGFWGRPGLTGESLVREVGGEVRRTFNLVPVVVADVPDVAVGKIKAHFAVRYVEPDARVRAIGQTMTWGLQRIGAPDVWGNTRGTGVKVGILDTGIDYMHEDLASNVYGGTNTIQPGGDYIDDNGHGTHVAGIAAAVDNTVGVVGVAPQAQLYAVKVLDSQGSGTISSVVAGLEWSVNNGIRIASMSLGTNFDSQTLHDACDAAYNSGNGVLLVAAAGNDGVRSGKGDTIDYPAAYTSVMAVGATDQTDTRAPWSSTGPALEIMAPGVNIYSTFLVNTYKSLSGTSMATPYVTGVAALLFATGYASASSVRDRIDATAEPIGDGNPNKYGQGLVNAVNAAGIILPSLEVSVSTDKAAYAAGETVTITTVVAQAGLPVEGATVKVSVTTPKGKKYSQQGTTDSAGRFVCQFTPSRRDGTGIYGVKSEASKSGYTSGSATTSFVVQ